MLWCSLLMLGLMLPPQDPAEDQEGGFRIGVAVDQVFLSVNARSVEGGFVEGLRQDELEVFENGVKQEIVNFYSQGVPVHVALLIDISGSTRNSQGEINRAALGFASSLAPEDRVAVITFNHEPRLLLDWTNDREKVELALQSTYAKGSTVLNDALYVAADDLLSEVEGKRAIIVLTDGIDTGSMSGGEEALDSVVRSEAIVYVVSKLEEYWAAAIGARVQLKGFTPREMSDSFILDARRFLGRLAAQTGGKVLIPGSSSLSDVYRQVADELKRQYSISYIPSNVLKDGKWRTIEVRSKRRGVILGTRPGYYAPLEIPSGN